MLNKKNMYPVTLCAIALAAMMTSWSSSAFGQERLETKVGRTFKIEVERSAQISWDVDPSGTELGRVCERDEEKEKELWDAWKKDHKVPLGGKYPKFFCFKAKEVGTATIVLVRKEVTSGESTKHRYTAKVSR